MSIYHPISNRWIVLFSLFWLIEVCSQPLEARECTPSVAWAVSVQGRVEFKGANESHWRAVRQDDRFCPGDRLRVLANSRAGLILYNESLLRLAENSSVLFSAANDDGNTLLDLLNGIGHFISPTHQSFRVNTPYINAFIQGTEFTVESHPDRAWVTVLEGRVVARNEQGEVVVEGGRRVDSLPGEAPRTEAVVNPRDAVQWALYYPPVFAPPAEHSSVSVRRSLGAYRRGDLSGAFSALAEEPGVAEDVALLVYRASLHLQVGGIQAARRDLAAVFSLQPEQVDALALMSLMATVRSDYQEALELARRAVRADAQSASAYLALSYAYQGRFQLAEAREAAREATLVAPENALAWARLAQLELMFRNLDASTVAANRAVGIAPSQSQSQITLGFSHLISFDLEGARESFERAVSLDQSAPLARLGLGLLRIREGDLTGGRGQLEIAANLDPGNALIRSYLGKAYYEETRDTQAAKQFTLAKGFDKLDPTAWFYDAIRKQADNRPIEALKDIQTSIELNDNRAVYRSRLLLDQDEAARGASQGRIYQDLGFDQLARVEANQSLQTSVQNHAAHRLLADSYSGLPRYEKARLSELLQSQLLQPLNTTPIQPQLAASNLGILDGAGPSASGFAEYTPLFTRNGLEFQLNAIGGNSGTRGDDLILSGLKDKVSFSLGQFHYETDGWRENSDLEQDIYDAFLQYVLSSSTSIQFEYRRQDAESGDLGLKFKPEDSSLTARNDLARRFGRIGIHHQFTPDSHFIASAIHQDMRKNHSESSSSFLPMYLVPPYGVLPATLENTYSRTEDSAVSSLELQYIQSLGRHTLTLGGGYYEEDYTDTSRLLNMIRFTNPVTSNVEAKTISDISKPLEPDPHFKDIYIYTLFALPARISMTLGAAFEDYERAFYKTQHLGPKFGLSWDVGNDFTVRAAYIEKLSRPIHFEQTIEQTQVVGFNQQFDDYEGSEIEQLGVGIDAKPLSGLRIGIEANRRDLRVPFPTPSEETQYENRDDKLFRGYLYWTVTDRLGIRIAHEREELKKQLSPPQALTTRRTPVGFSYYWPSGWYLDAEGTRINQRISRQSVSEQDDFWNVDFVLGYRFQKQYGKVELIAKNLLDEEFKYYDLSFHTAENLMPQFQPKRQLFARFTLNF